MELSIQVFACSVTQAVRPARRGQPHQPSGESIFCILIFIKVRRFCMLRIFVVFCIFFWKYSLPFLVYISHIIFACSAYFKDILQHICLHFVNFICIFFLHIQVFHSTHVFLHVLLNIFCILICTFFFLHVMHITLHISWHSFASCFDWHFDCFFLHIFWNYAIFSSNCVICD